MNFFEDEGVEKGDYSAVLTGNSSPIHSFCRHVFFVTLEMAWNHFKLAAKLPDRTVKLGYVGLVTRYAIPRLVGSVSIRHVTMYIATQICLKFIFSPP